jgi:hypothetical protein
MAADKQKSLSPGDIEKIKKVTAVERHPASTFPLWPIVIFALIIMIFVFLSDESDKIEIQLNTSSGSANNSAIEKQNIISTDKIHQVIVRGDIAVLKNIFYQSKMRK